MRFRDYFSLKHIILTVLVLALFIGFAVLDSNTQVKTYFEATSVTIKTDPYNMTIAYQDIESVELAPLAEAGEKVQDAKDDRSLRTGHWKNEAWGDYYICADLEATDCVVIRVKDGRVLVVSKKDNAETAKLYETFLTYVA